MNNVMRASIEQAELRHGVPGSASWWLDVPRDRWAAAIGEHAPRMRRSKLGRLLP